MTDSARQIAGRYFDQQLIEPLRQQIVGRRLIQPDPLAKGVGIDSVDVFRLSDMGAATISYRGPSGDKNNRQRDSIKVARETIDLPFLFKEFDIPVRDFNAFANKSVKMDVAAAVSAAQIVGEMEDDLIFNGWKGDGTNATIGGLMTLAGNTVSTSHSFATFGEPSEAAAEAIGMMSADKVRAPAYNMTLHPTQFNSLLGLQNANGILEIDNVRKILNRGNPNGPGDIIESLAVTAGKGVVTPVDPGRTYFELKIPQDMKTVIKPGDYEGVSDMTGLVWELAYPHIKQVNAVALLNSIA